MATVKLKNGTKVTIKESCPRRIHKEYQRILLQNKVDKNIPIDDVNEAMDFLVKELAEFPKDYSIDDMDANDFNACFSECKKLIAEDEEDPKKK